MENSIVWLRRKVRGIENIVCIKSKRDSVCPVQHYKRSGQKCNWMGWSKITRVFSSFWRDLFLVGLGRKCLGPTKIFHYFSLYQTTPNSLLSFIFSHFFSILPIQLFHLQPNMALVYSFSISFFFNFLSFLFCWKFYYNPVKKL